MKDSLVIIKLKEKENTKILTNKLFFREYGKTLNLKKGYIIFQIPQLFNLLDKAEVKSKEAKTLNMKVKLMNIFYLMEKARRHLRLGIIRVTKEIGKMDKCMVKDISYGGIRRNTKVILK